MKYRFTDHDRTITVLSEDYSPVDGISVTATSRELGLKTADFDAIGVISSASITVDDFVAGRFRDAIVNEYEIDNRFPWAGPIRSRTFWIFDGEFDDETWRAECSGVTNWLRQDVGDIVTRNCPYELGDVQCGVDLDVDSVGGGNQIKYVGIVLSSVETQRRVVRVASTIPSSVPAGFFKHGEVRWATGPNANLVSQIQRNTKPNSNLHEISFLEPTPFDITTSHQLTIVAGCNKVAGVRGNTAGNCKNEYGNLARFGGDPYTPGSDPSVRQPTDE